MARIVLTVCTCRRPDGLARLLRSLASIRVDGSFCVVVVENDAQQAGMAECRKLPADYPWDVQCVFEPNPGICSARNRAVREALEIKPDYIANLDDDEWPVEEWLEELLRVQAETGADAVGGPVVPVFPDDGAQWQRFREYYGAETNFADGQLCELYAGGNFLARAGCFASVMPEPFDPAFNDCGGEDLYFFKRLSQKGHRMAWAAQAVAFEEVPTNRMSHDWLLRRQRRRGQVNILVQRKINSSPVSGAVRAAKTTGVFVRAGFKHIINRLTGTTEPHAALDLMYGRGRLDAHFHRLNTRETVSHGGPSH